MNVFVCLWVCVCMLVFACKYMYCVTQICNSKIMDTNLLAYVFKVNFSRCRLSH